MKSLLNVLVLLLLVAFIGGCTSKDQIADILEKNPEVLTNAIEKNPDVFMESLNKAAMAYRRKQFEREQEDLAKSREDEYKSPKEPQILESRAIWGNKDAPITIVEYSDFQCPFCAEGYKRITALKEKYGDKIRVVYKHLPLPRHPLAEPAALYYEAVAKQDAKKAEKFHDLIFQNQDKLNADGVAYIERAVKEVGANLGRAKKAIETDEIKNIIEADKAEASKFGFRGTPGFLVNGVSLRGALPLEEFVSVIDRHLEKN